MKPLSPLKPKPAAGFSLIEVLIALMILSVGTLGIAAMTAVSLKSKNIAYSRTQANSLAYTILDRMRANRATALQHGYDIGFGTTPPRPPPGDCIGTTADCSPPEIADLDLSQWKYSLAKTLPSGDGSIRTAELDHTIQVTISVRWNDNRTGQGADAATQSFVATSAL